LLDHNGIIKYVDFGAAKIIAKQGKTRNGGGGATRTNLNSMTGTPMYMSPEGIFSPFSILLPSRALKRPTS
jgi:mitogen-activated protein kinase kinase kinase